MQTTLDIRIRDILQSGADIIVFSAHPSLLAGSGVSGIVHKAAGPDLELYAKSLGPIAPGESVITPALNLPSKYIIHTVCPRYIYGTSEEEYLLAMQGSHYNRRSLVVFNCCHKRANLSRISNRFAVAFYGLSEGVF